MAGEKIGRKMLHKYLVKPKLIIVAIIVFFGVHFIACCEMIILLLLLLRLSSSRLLPSELVPLDNRCSIASLSAVLPADDFEDDTFTAVLSAATFWMIFPKILSPPFELKLLLLMILLTTTHPDPSLR